MSRLVCRIVCSLAVLTSGLHLAGQKRVCGAEIDFSRDIRPLLAKHCFKCHGPDDKQRKAELRLDVRDGALRAAESGGAAIVPGKPDESELVQRIFSTDATETMPPPEVKNPLSESAKQLLKEWVAAGAPYKEHWALLPPKQVPPPKVQQADWPRNAIDYFVLAKLEAEGLHPSPEADRYVLARRLYLDLLGLPPTPEEVDAFVQDASPGAYENLVDHLFASPHYGERWARRWLDLARYADTNGYEKDRSRSIWPYRDWVIHALNADMPFDQFTIEQIAGDLLPNATTEQKVATGFHRNTMLNEEGGIDPLEFRFYAMTDRVNTTATVWLGLTSGCAQCHSHKYDPIRQSEYYQFMAFLNNADEPEMDVPQAEIAARRAEVMAKITAAEADLANRFPLESDFRWFTPKPESVISAGGATVEILDDDSFRFSGTNPDQDTYTVVINTDLAEVAAIRLEALTDPLLPKTGPGRTPHGNFVLSELIATVAPRDRPEEGQTVKLIRAEADYSQDGYPVADAVDGDPKTGWAIQGKDPWNVKRTATFILEKPLRLPSGSQWTFRIEQQYGTQHTLGRVRLSLGGPVDATQTAEVRRQEHLERKYKVWLERETPRAVHWTVLRPTEATSNMPLLTVLDDSSVLASGDQTKRDVYTLKFQTDLRGITAIRLEALPDDSLPKRGPGRVWYEGPFGDFVLSELTLAAHGRPVSFTRGTHSFAAGGSSAAMVIDGSPLSNWSIGGGQGRPHAAVFNLTEPLSDAGQLELQMVFEKYYAAGLGRFRISVTTDPKAAEARGLTADLEEILLIPPEQRTAEQQAKLLQHYLSVAPELAPEREAIKKLRDQMPAYSSTLVMTERPAVNPRPTFIYRRGEFLQPTERVLADVLSVLPGLPKEAPRNRLSFARWLVDPANPLVGRVTMNRHWGAFFGRGIVRTTEDFGFQGELPTQPELLDWLAVQFVNEGWSIKKMQRLIVTSATYRQSSRVTPELLERDPQNKLLARGPRFRIEAELVRDMTLRISGLLSPKLGGPSVFPPQPPGITTEGTFGGLPWNVSTGEDRYRRGLYTFSKRTAPFAMFGIFDAPSGEACVPRREASNTPLQALTVLNDISFVETAQALGRQLAAQAGSVDERVVSLFRRCLTRPPNAEELETIVKFYRVQRERFEKKELDAAAVAGPGEGDPIDRAAWTAAARALLNLDETITKE